MAERPDGSEKERRASKFSLKGCLNPMVGLYSSSAVVTRKDRGKMTQRQREKTLAELVRDAILAKTDEDDSTMIMEQVSDSRYTCHETVEEDVIEFSDGSVYSFDVEYSKGDSAGAFSSVSEFLNYVSEVDDIDHGNAKTEHCEFLVLEGTVEQDTTSFPDRIELALMLSDVSGDGFHPVGDDGEPNDYQIVYRKELGELIGKRAKVECLAATYRDVRNNKYTYLHSSNVIAVRN